MANKDNMSGEDGTIDETYRGYYSGRFGPSPVDINYNTQISGASAVTKKDKPEKKKQDIETPKEDLGNDEDEG